MSLGGYRLALDEIMRALRVALLPLLRASDWQSSDSQKKVAREVAAVVREHRVKAADAAGEFMKEQAAAVSDAPAFVPAPEGYPDAAVEQVLRESRSVDEVLGALERHVETAARRQVVRAVPAADDDSGLPGFEDMFEDAEKLVKKFEASDKAWDDLASFVPHIVDDHEEADDDVPAKAKLVFPQGWARVPTGAETCPFCFMLVSRGPVYSSAAHAGKRSTKVKQQGKDFLGRKRMRVSRVVSSQAYHDHCDCMVVPVYDTAGDWPGKEQFERLDAEWRALGKKLGTAPTLANWRDHLEEHPVKLPDVRKAA